MTIGVLNLELLIHEARSLKDKRRVLKSLKDQLHSRFNCAVAETAYNDVWGRARLTVCVVSNESRHADSQLAEIARFASARANAEVVDYSTELI